MLFFLITTMGCEYKKPTAEIVPYTKSEDSVFYRIEHNLNIINGEPIDCCNSSSTSKSGWTIMSHSLK